MITGVSIRLDFSGFRRLDSGIERQLSGMSAGRLRRVMKQWAARYRAFVRREFIKNSKGSGDWPPFSPNTRRKRGSMDAALLLRDTNTLLAALDPTFSGSPGAIEQDIPYGVRVGYGGPAKHPSGEATVAAIASFHNEGGGRLPKRLIIRQPQQTLLHQMAGDVAREYNRDN